MTKFHIGLSILLFSLSAMITGYNYYDNMKNREVYLECLKIAERIAENDNREGVRIVSLPNCYKR